MTLIDLVCSSGHVHVDVLVDSPASRLICHLCGSETQRAWLSAPAITPGGTRAERNTDRQSDPPPIDKKKIALDTTFEVEQKWNRYSDPKVAEQHVSREINEAAGIADYRGNEIPIPKAPPILFEKPSLAECAQ